MKNGVLRLNPSFLEPRQVAEFAAAIDPADWVATHPDGPYSGEAWRVIKLIEEQNPTPFFQKYTWVQQIAERLQCKIVSMVFYSILPGGALHKHRDISATLELGRLRFHIPLQTNHQVTFHVGGKDHMMCVGELWALNTSYIHAVSNFGPTDRIHLVIEVEVNEWVWSLLPKKNTAYYVHMFGFFAIVGWTAMKTCLFEPRRFWGRFHLARWMMSRFWRKIRGEYAT